MATSVELDRLEGFTIAPHSRYHCYNVVAVTSRQLALARPYIGVMVAGICVGRNRLTGTTTFSNNRAYYGGAIYYRSDSSTVTYPDDTIFDGNTASVRRDRMLSHIKAMTG